MTYTVTAIRWFDKICLTGGTTQVTANTTVTLAQLQGLKYKTVADANGSSNLSWHDQENDGTRCVEFSRLPVRSSITVTAVNDVPLRTAGSPAAISVNEDSARSEERRVGKESRTRGAGDGKDE